MVSLTWLLNLLTISRSAATTFGGGHGGHKVYRYQGQQIYTGFCNLGYHLLGRIGKEKPIPSEEDRSAQPGSSLRQHGGPEQHSLDTLAKGLANNAVSRGQVLKMIGGALAGAALALLLPRVAKGEHGPVDFGEDGPVAFGEDGPVNFEDGPMDFGEDSPVDDNKDRKESEREKAAAVRCEGECNPLKPDQPQCAVGCICVRAHAYFICYRG